MPLFPAVARLPVLLNASELTPGFAPGGSSMLGLAKEAGAGRPGALEGVTRPETLAGAVGLDLGGEDDPPCRSTRLPATIPAATRRAPATANTERRLARSAVGSVAARSERPPWPVGGR